MWLHFPFASLKGQYQPNFVLHTRQRKLSPLESQFHWRDVQNESQLSCWRQRVLSEQEMAVTPGTGGPCLFLQSGHSPTGSFLFWDYSLS